MLAVLAVGRHQGKAGERLGPHHRLDTVAPLVEVNLEPSAAERLVLVLAVVPPAHHHHRRVGWARPRLSVGACPPPALDRRHEWAEDGRELEEVELSERSLRYRFGLAAPCGTQPTVREHARDHPRAASTIATVREHMGWHGSRPSSRELWLVEQRSYELHTRVAWQPYFFLHGNVRARTC